MVKVRFRGVWDGFSPYDGGLPSLVRAAVGGAMEVVTSDKEFADLEVCSVFPSRSARLRQLARAAVRRSTSSAADYRGTLGEVRPLPSARASVWFTGENLRPPAPSHGWDLTLSFDPDTWPRNAYLPLWLLHTDAFGDPAPGFLGRHVSLRDLTGGRPSQPFGRRPKFACAFIRNPQPTRLTVIEALGELGKVDVYGPLTGRPTPDKISVAANYRFMICLENDLYPGYVTEKPVEAWASGCVPLWWGLDRDANLNPRALVNLAACDGLGDFVQEVGRLEEDATQLELAWRQPLVTTIPNVSTMIARVRELLK